MTGFAVGTAVITGPSFTQCSDIAAQYVIKLQHIRDLYTIEYNRFLRHYDWDMFQLWPFLLINDELIWLLYHVYDLSNGCFNGGFEYYASLLNYVDWYENPSLMLYNVLYNFGFIYTNVRDVYMYIRQDRRSII